MQSLTNSIPISLLNFAAATSTPPQQPSSTASPLAACVAAGDFAGVLSDPDVRAVLAPEGAESAAAFYDGVSAKVQQVFHAALSSGDSTRLVPLLAAGASSLNLFVQHNLTGPFHSAALPSPIDLLAPHTVTPEQRPQSTPSATPSSTPSQPFVSAPTDTASTTDHSDASQAPNTDHSREEQPHPHESLAASHLTLDGEDLVTHKLCHLQHLLLSEALLVGPLLAAATQSPSLNSTAHSISHSSTAPSPICSHTCETLHSTHGTLGGSWLWWALRVTRMHQHVLSGRSASLLARTNALTKHLLASVAAQPPLSSIPSSANAHTSQQVQPPSASPIPAAAAAVPAGVKKDLTQIATAAKAGGGVVPSALAGASSSPPHSWAHTLQEQPSLHACMLLELAQGQYSYGFVEHGQKLLNEAGSVLGLQVQLSGALGRRTVHQIDSKAQLVVRASRARIPPSADSGNTDPAVTSLGFEPILQPQAVGGAGSSAAEGEGADKMGARLPTQGMVDESDVFMAPKLVAEDGQVLEPRYSATEQALLLAWAMHVKKGSAQDELQQWEMAPYVEAVLSQPHSHMMLQATARLLKVRHERTRNRTRERALLHLEQLHDALALAAHPPPQESIATASNQGEQMHTSNGTEAQGSSSSSSSAASVHLPYAYSCWFPLRVQLRKELAEHYMSMGFVGAALGIYEELQLWDALVVCYRLLDKRSAAEDLLKRRLKVTPNDPVIWCNLGDLYTDDSYYEEAWTRSGCRHGRSKRSLGRSALRRKDWAAAAAHFEAALAVNPLNPDAWFSQGYAYLKIGEQRKALRALTHVTQQVPDHAEAWNNVAALWLEMGEPKRAYSALGECLRYKRDSWQIWENYAQVAQQAGFPMQATRALGQVLQLSAGTRLHLPVLHQLVQAVEDIQKGELTAFSPACQPTSNGHAETDADKQKEEEEDDLAGFVLDIPVSFGQQQWAVSSEGDAEAEADYADAALPSKSEYQAGVAAARQRTEEQMCLAVGKLLKDAVNLPCCNPEVWGLLGRYYGLSGQLDGAKEALLKQVRALSGSAAFKSDEARFIEVADASLALAGAYMQLYRGSSPPTSTAGQSNGNAESTSAASSQLGPGESAASPTATGRRTIQQSSVRELAAARMHLRGLLKQCEPAFGEHAKWTALSDACAEISNAEAEAKALIAQQTS